MIVNNRLWYSIVNVDNSINRGHFGFICRYWRLKRSKQERANSGSNSIDLMCMCSYNASSIC